MSTARFAMGNLNVGQRVAVKYFTMAIVLLLAQVAFGLLAGYQYLHPDFLYDTLDFNVNRTLHIDAMVVWMLAAFIGGVYWLIEEESGVPLVGGVLANTMFFIFAVAVAVVVVVFLLVQRGPSNQQTLWLVMEGREYIEAPRWADIGIVAVLLAFFYNAIATFQKGKWSGISGVLVLDLVALAGIYLAGMFYTTNVTMDQYWWWWVIHLWVEATWEVLVGCIMAWGLIKTLGARRQIVTTWLYIEVALMFGAGVWGFMQTLPQINLYTHGTQWAASHGHLAFYGAYATINFAVFYLAVQQWRGGVQLGAGLVAAWRWKWSFALLNLGALGMTIALLVSGYQQAFIERAEMGSTWQAFFAAQNTAWFIQGMFWRQVFGWCLAAGAALLVWDLVCIGNRETRMAVHPVESTVAAAA